MITWYYSKGNLIKLLFNNNSSFSERGSVKSNTLFFSILLTFEQDSIMDYPGLIMPGSFLSSVKITEHIPGQDRWLPWFLQRMAGVHAWPGNSTPLGKVSIPQTRSRTRWSHLTKPSFWINQSPELFNKSVCSSVWG